MKGPGTESQTAKGLASFDQDEEDAGDARRHAQIAKSKVNLRRVPEPADALAQHVHKIMKAHDEMAEDMKEKTEMQKLIVANARQMPWSKSTPTKRPPLATPSMSAATSPCTSNSLAF